MTRKRSVIKNRFSEHLSLKARHEGRKITRRDAEEETGVSRVTIDRYYHNKTARYDMEVVAKLCEWLGISVTEFFIEDDPEETEINRPLLATA